MTKVVEAAIKRQCSSLAEPNKKGQRVEASVGDFLLRLSEQPKKAARAKQRTPSFLNCSATKSQFIYPFKRDFVTGLVKKKKKEKKERARHKSGISCSRWNRHNLLSSSEK